MKQVKVTKPPNPTEREKSLDLKDGTFPIFDQSMGLERFNDIRKIPSNTVLIDCGGNELKSVPVAYLAWVVET